MENSVIKTKVVPIQIEGKTAQFEILENDESKVFEIIKSFPDGIFEKNNSKDGKRLITLTPQLWWGNLTGAKVIILGLNPSCVESDINDNDIGKDFFINNLKTQNRDDLNINILFNQKETLKVLNYWKNVLKGLDEKEYSNVAIYNMFGYYKTHLDSININLSHFYEPTNEQFKTIKDQLIEKIIDESTSIYIMWKNTKTEWIQLLSHGISEEDKKIN